MAQQLLQQICDELNIDAQQSAGGVARQHEVLREALRQLGLSQPATASTESILEMVCDQLDLEVAYEVEQSRGMPELEPDSGLEIEPQPVDGTIPSRTEGTGSGTTDAAEVVNEVEKEQEQQEPRAWLLQRISQELEIPADSSRGVLGEAVHQLGLGEATNQGTDAQRLEAVCEFLDIDMMNAPGLISDRVQVPAAGAMSDVLEPVMPEPESEPPLQVTGDVGIRRSVLVAKEDGGDLPRTVVAAIRRELDIPPSVVACTTDEGLIAEAVRQLGLNVTGISSIQRKAAMIFEYLDLDSAGIDNTRPNSDGNVKQQEQAQQQQQNQQPLLPPPTTTTTTTLALTPTPTPTPTPTTNQKPTIQNRRPVRPTSFLSSDDDAVRPERWPPDPPKPDWFLPEWERIGEAVDAWREATISAEKRFEDCWHLAQQNAVALAINLTTPAALASQRVAPTNSISEGIPPRPPVRGIQSESDSKPEPELTLKPEVQEQEGHSRPEVATGDQAGVPGKEKMWKEMTDAELSALRCLGYTEQLMWDDAPEDDEGVYSRSWRSLSTAEKDACAVLGMLEHEFR